jgi:hypothetical protein
VGPKGSPGVPGLQGPPGSPGQDAQILNDSIKSNYCRPEIEGKRVFNYIYGSQ